MFATHRHACRCPTIVAMDSYDYVVVGAGSAGCAVAARLSEDPASRVLLVEAGGSDRRLDTRAPAAFGAQFHTKVDWDYVTEPEPAANGRRIYQPRGKVLGGTSAMNAMLWVRGSDLDYDGWGVPGWAWSDVEPVFRRIERHFLTDSAHGQVGPIRVNRLSDPDPVARGFVEAAVSAGVPRVDDVSGPELAGVSLSPTTTAAGRRWSTARGYLDVARRRPNLTVVAKALVTRVVLREGRAAGIELERGGRIETILARREVVLSAGAFNTPQLLQLSGIGDADHLRDVGIEVVVDNPAVGAHLTEHPMTFVNYELREPWIGLADAKHPKHLANWLLRGKGKLASNVAEAIAHIRTLEDLPAPDMQIVHAPAYFWNNGEAEHPRPAMCMAQSYWTPKSRGTVRLRSRDPRQAPAILMNMLSAREDVDALIRGIRFTRELARHEPLRDMLAVEIHPGEHVQTDVQLTQWIRETCLHTYHPACTARIGEPGEGVVDAQLRVHGVEGLRVADASVLPVITRANTNAPAIMVGERCAEFIRDPDRAPAAERIHQLG